MRNKKQSKELIKNLKIEDIKKNLRCLEYIVVHEMVYLLERKHNDVFKGYMDKFFPDWRIVKNEINGIVD